MQTPDGELLALRDLAVQAARAGGTAALDHFRQPGLDVEWKRDESPVTVADRESEAAIRAVIAQARPHDGWQGEETGTATGTSGLTWIVDPVDGTRNFVRGVPLWATLVACEGERQGRRQVVASAVHIPALDEMYDAALGHGARTCVGRGDWRRIAVSSITRLDQALWCYETPGWFRKFGLGPLFDTLCDRTHLQRGLCDAYGHVLVASGRAELVVEPSLEIWDVAATSLVVTEAGGRFSDLDGTSSIRSRHAVVTNGHLHDEVLALIRTSRR